MKNFMSFLMRTLCGLSIGTGIAGCQSTIDKAVRNTKYSAYEMIGVEKRDLLGKYVKDTKNAQEDTKEAFKDALDQLKKTYTFDGGKLERQYNALNSSYEETEKRANIVRKDIDKVEKVAADLFAEWKKEISEISTESLRSKSRAQLNDTQKRFSQLRTSLKGSEAKIQPVLTKLKDHVLYLKHNLNAKAVASLKGETVRIEAEIASLIKSIESSINESDVFIKDIQ